MVKSSHYFFLVWFGLVECGQGAQTSLSPPSDRSIIVLHFLICPNTTSFHSHCYLCKLYCTNHLCKQLAPNDLHLIICPNTTLGSIRTAIPTVQTALSKSNHVSTCPHYIVQTICTELHSLALGAALSPFPILCHRNLTDKLVQLGQTLLLLVFAALVGVSICPNTYLHCLHCHLCNPVWL